MERILVTGGSGFLGHHVAAELRQRGLAFDTLDRALATWNVDIRQPIPIQIQGFSRVIHLAGVLGTHELFDRVHTAIEVNITGTVSVLELCRREDIPFTGITMPHIWTNPYETTKLAAERLAEAWGREYDFPVNYVTVYNAYGPHQMHGIHHPQKIVPTFSVAAWRDRPIPIWGDGSQVVDLVYAGDVARLLIDSPRIPFPVEGGRGVGLTVLEVAELIWSMVRDTPPKVEFLPMRKGEHKPAFDPVAKMPVIPERPFEDTLWETVQWYRYPNKW